MNGMKPRVALLAFTAGLILGCAGAGSTPGAPASPTASPRGTPTSPPTTPTAPPSIFPTDATPSEFRQGPEGLIADLEDAGTDAEVVDSFDGEPLAQVQTMVCVDGEDIAVFTYGTEQERAAVSSRIDPDDPYNVGTAIVEWDGWPKFWQRDRIIVLYLGSDEATIDLLTELMGEPFSQGIDRPRRLEGPCQSV